MWVFLDYLGVSPISKVDHITFLVPKVLRSPCGKGVKLSHPIYCSNYGMTQQNLFNLNQRSGGDKALKLSSSKHEVPYKSMIV